MTKHHAKIVWRGDRDDLRAHEIEVAGQMLAGSCSAHWGGNSVMCEVRIDMAGQCRPGRNVEGWLDVPDSPAVHEGVLTGGCLCGEVRFELTAAPLTAGYCHCTRCQRRTGTASSAQARIDGRTLRLLQGEELLKAWRHPEGGHEKLFCGACGAHLFSRDADNHAQMSVRMGAFDTDPGIRPSWRSFVSYAALWEPIPDDGLERYGEAKPRHQPA